MASPARSTRFAWLAPLVIIASALIHLPALQWWWLWDDPQLVLHAIQVPAWQTLFDPEAYRTLAAHTFTPLLPLSFKLDFILAGFSARGAYAHQLFVLLIAALLFDQLLRRYVDRWVAAFSAATLVASWMVVYATRTLMIRHYAEGLVAALAALIIWSGRRADGARMPYSPLLEAGGSLLWFLSLLSKEIYAPLPLLLILQRRANGERLRDLPGALIAPAIAAVVWLGWRTYMLGSLGGYGTRMAPADLMLLPWRAVNVIAGPEGRWGGWALMVVTILLAVIASVKDRRTLAGIAAFVITALLPVATLAGNFEWRFGFGPAVLLAAGFALALARAIPHLRAQRIIAALMLALTLSAAPFGARAYRTISEPVEVEGRYIWTADSRAPMLRADAPAWYLSGIRDLRHLLKVESAPRFVVSDEAFISGGAAPEGYVRWKPETRRLEPLDAASFADRQALEQPGREPLMIEVRRDGELLAWSFDGPPDAQWAIVTLPEFAVWPVPAKGERRLPANADPGFFYVLVMRSDGSWTTSIERPIPLNGEVVRWVAK